MKTLNYLVFVLDLKYISKYLPNNKCGESVDHHDHENEVEHLHQHSNQYHLDKASSAPSIFTPNSTHDTFISNLNTNNTNHEQEAAALLTNHSINNKKINNNNNNDNNRNLVHTNKDDLTNNNNNNNNKKCTCIENESDVKSISKMDKHSYHNSTSKLNETVGHMHSHGHSHSHKYKVAHF